MEWPFFAIVHHSGRQRLLRNSLDVLITFSESLCRPVQASRWTVDMPTRCKVSQISAHQTQVAAPGFITSPLLSINVYGLVFLSFTSSSGWQVACSNCYQKKLTRKCLFAVTFEMLRFTTLFRIISWLGPSCCCVFLLLLAVAIVTPIPVPLVIQIRMAKLARLSGAAGGEAKPLDFEYLHQS